MAAYAVLLAGGAMMWSSTSRLGTRPPTRIVLAGLLIGFGGFNVVEGVVDHLILGVHHVREGSTAHVYDTAFLVASMIVLAAGVYEQLIGDAVEARRPAASRPRAVRHRSAPPRRGQTRGSQISFGSRATVTQAS